MTVRVIDHSDEVFRSVYAGLARAVSKSAIRVQGEARRLTSQASGPPPSAPGSPPHLRTGTLSRSIDQELLRDDREIIGRVGTNLNYGKWLEIGTRKMAKRPYLRPALDGMRSRIESDIREAGRALR